MNHNNLYLSIGSAIGSLLSGLVATATAYHVMWILSAIAAVVSICAGILTVKEKRMSIRYMSDRLKNKSGGTQ